MEAKLHTTQIIHVQEQQPEYAVLLSKNLKFNLKDGLKWKQLLKMKMEMS